MNWSNVAPIILEKVMFYAAQKEKREQKKGITSWSEYKEFYDRSTWLLTIEKFCRVSVHWKKVAFSSKILFPSDESIHFDNENEKLGEEAKTLLKAGFLPMVKEVHIGNPEAFQYTGNVKETSLRSIEIVTFRRTYEDDMDEGTYVKWTGEDIRSMMDIVSKSPHSNWFTFSYHLQNQNDAVLFWQFLLKIIHCNSKPKTIYLEIDTTDCDRQIDWDFIKTSETSGTGSIESLIFQKSPIDQLYSDAISHLSKSVEIYQLGAEDLSVGCADFARQIQAKCFMLDDHTDSLTFDRINWTDLKDYEKVIVKGTKNGLTRAVENVDHPNVHFALCEKFITHRTNNIGSDLTYRDRGHRVDRIPVKLISALPASKVKTLTYPGENGYLVTSVRFLPVPETTFVCDSLLAKNLNKFIDDAKVRPFSNTVPFH